jgi:hypothetical protein
MIQRIARALAALRKEEDRAAGFPIVESRYAPPLAMDIGAAEWAIAALDQGGYVIVHRDISPFKTTEAAAAVYESYLKIRR